MGRSAKRSVTIPHPLADLLDMQLQRKIIDYPSSNAAINGMILYQGLAGAEHHLTSRIAYMHLDHQDAIHDFALELTVRGKSVMGSFIRHVAERVAAGLDEPDPDTIIRLQADHILELALRYQRGDETIWDDL